MKHSDTLITRGSHRGIGFEINHPRNHYGFTYYIALDLEHIEDKEIAESFWLTARESTIGKSKNYDYYNVEFFNEIHFHGGITWYSKLFNSNDNRIVKLGCDYSHSWDTGKYYDLDMVLKEVERTINDIHKGLKYLLWCHGDGRLVPEIEGTYSKHGDFWSNEYLKEHDRVIS